MFDNILSARGLARLYVEASDLTLCGENPEVVTGVLERLDELICRVMPAVAEFSSLLVRHGEATRDDATVHVIAAILWPAR